MRDIQAGDLVMVVRWPHEHVPKRIGAGFVSEVKYLQPKTKCPDCGEVWQRAACLAYGGAVPVAWLRKVPRARPEQPAENYTESRRFVWRGS